MKKTAVCFFLSLLLLTGCAKHDVLADLMKAIKNDDLAAVQAVLLKKPELEPACGLHEVCKPLAFAAEFGNMDIIKALFVAGADVNGKVAYGNSAFMMATKHAALMPDKPKDDVRKTVRAVQMFLLERGANPNQPNDFGITPFLGIVAAGDFDMMTFAIQHNANVNFQNKDGWTPLMAAAQFGQTDSVRFLLAYGADRSLKDKKGKTAYDYAIEFKQSAVATLLKQ